MTQQAPDLTRRTEYVPLDDVAPATLNAKNHDLPALIESVRRWGFTTPALLDERTERLVAGHGRLDALRALRDDNQAPPDGITTAADGAWLVPVLRGWSSRDDASASAYLVADNRLTEAGGWDDHALAELLTDVADHDPALLAATGYSAADLERLLESVKPKPDRRGRDDWPDDNLGDDGWDAPARGSDSTESDDDPTSPVPTGDVPQDVWLLGAHRLICGPDADQAVTDALCEAFRVLTGEPAVRETTADTTADVDTTPPARP